MCRFTTSVIALLAITIGMVLITSGVCILVFFVEQEPTVLPLGITLSVLGLLTFLIGGCMWISEFVFNDCLGRAYVKMKEAPLKNALERRSRLASRYKPAFLVYTLLIGPQQAWDPDCLISLKSAWEQTLQKQPFPPNIEFLEQPTCPVSDICFKYCICIYMFMASIYMPVTSVVQFLHVSNIHLSDNLVYKQCDNDFRC